MLFAGVHRGVVRVLTIASIGGLMLILSLFVGIFSHDGDAAGIHRFMKEIDIDRLTPNNYHQKAAATSIAVGGLTGTGWKQGEFAGKKWLPAAHTDSVFAAYGEEFGFIGLVILLFLFFALIYFSLQVAAVAKDPFGRCSGSRPGGLSRHARSAQHLNDVRPVADLWRAIDFRDLWRKFHPHDDGCPGDIAKHL